MSTPKIISDTMVKIVNIDAPYPIRKIYPVIYGKMKHVMMAPKNILICLQNKAKVEEVLPNGRTIQLNFENYNQDNSKMLSDTAKETPTTQATERNTVFPTTTAPKKEEQHTANIPDNHVVNKQIVANDTAAPTDSVKTDDEKKSDTTAVNNSNKNNSTQKK